MHGIRQVSRRFQGLAEHAAGQLAGVHPYILACELHAKTGLQPLSVLGTAVGLTAPGTFPALQHKQEP